MTRYETRGWSAEGKALRHVPCGVCGADDGRTLAVENGLSVARCRRCGVLYVTPQPEPFELERFYERYYPEDSEADWQALLRDVFRRDAARIRALCDEPGRLLDVGAGYGHFLDEMAEGGWEVAAVETSPAALCRLRRRGYGVYEGLLPDVALPEAHFDVVTGFSVLEHVSDPLGVLERARATLRPGGRLFVRVPNAQLLSFAFALRRFEQVSAVRALVRVLRREIMEESNLFYAIDPPGHLFGFDGRTLADCIGRAGFADVVVRADRIQQRGTRLNRWIDGALFRAGEALRRSTGGRLCLSPNLWAVARRPA